MLSKLFPARSEYVYVAHPRQIFYGIFIMAVGWATMTRDHWFTFGISVFIIGIILSIVIMIAIAWEKVIRYWEILDQFANTMIKANNPDLWQALGFKSPPQQVEIIETSEETKDEGWRMKIHRLPVSPAVMQSIADKVIYSGKTDFIEADFTNVPNIRKVKNELKAKGLLSPKNKKNVRLGYTFNKKGMDVLYEYASEVIKMEVKRRLDE